MKSRFEEAKEKVTSTLIINIDEESLKAFNKRWAVLDELIQSGDKVLADEEYFDEINRYGSDVKIETTKVPKELK